MDQYQVPAALFGPKRRIITIIFLLQRRARAICQQYCFGVTDVFRFTGLFLLFIFIGIGVFSDSTDPFAAVVNAGLTISAALGTTALQLPSRHCDVQHYFLSCVNERFLCFCCTRHAFTC